MVPGMVEIGGIQIKEKPAPLPKVGKLMCVFLCTCYHMQAMQKYFLYLFNLIRTCQYPTCTDQCSNFIES